MMFRQTLLLAGQNFSGWHRNARIWMTFALGLVMCFMLTDQMIGRAQIYNSSVQIFEPFIWTFGDAQSVMLSSVLLLVLFADMPFTGQEAPYCLIRTTRKIWLMGQVLYVISAVVIYNVFLFAVEALIALPWAYPGNVWSASSAALAYGAGENAALPVSLKTMESSTPFECMALVFLLMLLYSLFIAAFMLFLNLSAGGAAGVIGAILMNLYGYLLNPEFFMKIFEIPRGAAYRANILCGWLSPLNHATFPMHGFGYDFLPRIYVSAALFAVGIGILTGFSMRRMKKYNFEFQQVEE